MLRARQHALLVGEFHQLAEVHHCDTLADVPHHRDVMRDEEVGEAQRRLEIAQQIQHLGLDGDVERRDRLVGDDEARVERQGAGDAEALALPAGELVG